MPPARDLFIFLGKFTNIPLNWSKILSLNDECHYYSIRVEEKFI
jgi:hypothetical protein